MTQREFNELPPLLTRRQVASCGLDYKAISDFTFLCEAGKEPPPGHIGAVRIRKYFRYRKKDVAKMCGFDI